MEYYLAIRNDDLLPFRATRIDLENIILSEMSKSEKNVKWLLGGSGLGRAVRRDRYAVTECDLTSGDEHTMQSTVQML